MSFVEGSRPLKLQREGCLDQIRQDYHSSPELSLPAAMQTRNSKYESQNLLVAPDMRQALGRYLGVKLIWMVLASLDPRNPKPGAALNTPGSSNSGHNYTKKNPTKIV